MDWNIRAELVILITLCIFSGIYSQANYIQRDTSGSPVVAIQDTGHHTQNKIAIKGKVYSLLITDTDTLVLADIEGVSISSPRAFANPDDYKRYMRYKYYVAKVYPYAKEAIRIFREQEYLTENMKKKHRKKYIKRLQEELNIEFEEPLKKLSRTQGKILVKMIERELDTPMHTLIQNLNGKWKAFYWNQFSKLYGYRLNTGYIEGENPILDIVLQDLDISYTIDESQ